MSNVRDFGAMGDGIEDDSEAIQHAIDVAGGLIEFPRGDYRITKPIMVELTKVGRVAFRGEGGTAKPIMAGEGPVAFAKERFAAIQSKRPIARTAPTFAS